MTDGTLPYQHSPPMQLQKSPHWLSNVHALPVHVAASALEISAGSLNPSFSVMYS